MCLYFVNRNFPLSLLEYFWKLLKAGLPVVLPKLYLWFNYSAVQIPDSYLVKAEKDLNKNWKVE